MWGFTPHPTDILKMSAKRSLARKKSQAIFHLLFVIVYAQSIDQDVKANAERVS